MQQHSEMNSDKSRDFIKYECPSCGATLNLDPFNPVVKCQYCGCNFLKTDDVSKKILLDALELKKLEKKLAAAIASNSWDVQYQCYKALALGTDNELYNKFYEFWEVLLGHNDITASFIKQYSLEELKKFLDILEQLPSTCIIMGTPLATLAVKQAFTHVIKLCEVSEYSVSDTVDMEYNKRAFGIKPAKKKAFPVHFICYGIAAVLSIFPIYTKGLTRESCIIVAVIFGAAFTISLLMTLINDTLDNNSIINYKIRFPNGILTPMNFSVMMAMQQRKDSVSDTYLDVYQDGIDITFKRTLVNNNKTVTKSENIFIPYVNIATARPLGSSALSIKQRYTTDAYAFEIEEVSSAELQSLVAYINARMRHYQNVIV